MTEATKKRLPKLDQSGPAGEAMLNLFVATDYLRDRMEATCASFGITLSQYKVLHILRVAHPLGYSRNEIVQRMIERAPDVTRLVDRLEQQRLALRRRSNEDRRLSVTSITDAGLRLLDNIEPVMDTLQLEFFGNRLGERDCLELSRICEEIFGVSNGPVSNGGARRREAVEAEEPEHAISRA